MRQIAKVLADLLRANLLPEVWIPDERVLKLRDLTRHKSNLTRLRIHVQVKIKGYLLRKGMKYGKQLWNEKALTRLAEENPDIRNLINVYWGLKNEEKEVIKRIRKTAKNYERSEPAYVDERYRRALIPDDTC